LTALKTLTNQLKEQGKWIEELLQKENDLKNKLFQANEKLKKYEIEFSMLLKKNKETHANLSLKK
jgi:hypothetical protein